MHFTSISLALAATSFVAAVPFRYDTATPTSTVEVGTLAKRDVSSLPTADITCAGGVFNGQPYGPKSFNDFQVEDAVQKGLNDLANKQTNGKYPDGFRNDESFTFASCPAGSSFYEYPILKDGTVYRAGEPGAYRAIFLDNGGGNGVFCGLVYHPDNTKGGFKPCS